MKTYKILTTIAWVLGIVLMVPGIVFLWWWVGILLWIVPLSIKVLAFVSTIMILAFYAKNRKRNS